ncbi:MAG: hypothetical protein LIO86_00790 [Lachnospiraceae bacterium]|nr:hypothetical protein [Lachnospiraceae bacterium]
MILKQYYRDEIAEYVRTLPEESFRKSGWSRPDVLQDQGILEQLWTAFQKMTEDYGCDEDWSKQEAVCEVLGIACDGV